MARGIIVSAACLAACALAPRLAAEEPEIVALYRGGSVTRSEVESWRAFRRSSGEQPLRERQVRSVALLEIYELATADAGLLESGRGKLLAEEQSRSLAGAALEKSLNVAARPSEEEVLRYWQDHQEEFRRPRRWKLENIFLARQTGSGQDAAADRSAELEAVRRAIVEGADFGEMVALHSESTTRDRGGLTGWAYEDRLLAPVAAALEPLEVGDVSPVIATARGWTLVRVVDRTPAGVLDFDRVRGQLHSRLTKERLGPLSDDLDRELFAHAAPIEVTPATGDSDGSAIAVSYRDGERRDLLTVEQVKLFRAGQDPSPDSTSPSADAWRRSCEALVLAESRAAEAARRGLTETEEFENDLFWSRRHLVANLWVSAQVEGTLPHADDGELRAAFEEHAAKFAVPERSHLRLLEVALGKETPAPVVARAEDLGPSLAAGEMTFEEAAAQIDSSGAFARIRDLGWLDEKSLFHLGFRLQPLAGELGVGARTPLVQQGPYLLMLEKLATRPAHQPTFEEARDRVVVAVRARRLHEAQQALEERLLLEHEFTMVADAL